QVAEGVGFEPTDPYGSPVFKTGAIDHSAIPPDRATPTMPRRLGLANDLGLRRRLDVGLSGLRLPRSHFRESINLASTRQKIDNKRFHLQAAKQRVSPRFNCENTAAKYSSLQF